MSQWADRFSDHGLWEKVDTIADSLSAVQAPNDESLRDDLARLQWLARHLQQRRTSTDPLEVTATALDATEAVADNVYVNLQTYSDDSPEALANAAAKVDGVLTTLTAWPSLAADERAAAGFQALSDQRKSIEQAMAALVVKKEELEADLDRLSTVSADLRAEVDRDKGRLDQAVSDFSDASSARIEAVVAEDQPRLTEQLDLWLAQRQEQDIEWGATRAARLSEAERLLETLRGHEEQAKKTVHATAAVSVATDYGRYARNKTIAAWICDLAAAAVGTVGVAAIIRHLYEAEAGADGSVGLSLTRLAASLGTLGIAALIGKRGAQHHREARAAKRTDLAVQRVGPFTANLDETVQRAAIEDMTQRIFIEGRLDDVRRGGDDSPFAGKLAELRATRDAG